MTTLDDLALTAPCRVCGAPVGAACTIYRPTYGQTAHQPRQLRALDARSEARFKASEEAERRLDKIGAEQTKAEYAAYIQGLPADATYAHDNTEWHIRTWHAEQRWGTSAPPSRKTTP